jgi:tight adherence protein B
MRAGRSFVGGITAVADSADEPIRSELERALADEKLGLPLEDTLQSIAERMRSEDMEQVALIASLHRRSGSNVAESLDRVAEGARERADMRRELKALSAQARISGRVLTGLPPVLLVALNVIDPSYAKPMTGTTIGLVVLSFCVVLVIIGWIVMNRIVNLDP